MIVVDPGSAVVLVHPAVRGRAAVGRFGLAEDRCLAEEKVSNMTP